MAEPALTVIDRRADLVVVQVLSDRLDERNLSAVRADASAAGKESPGLPVVLDLSKVAFMPSLSLGGLIQLLQEFKARGQRLVLASVQPLVRETMALTRLDRLFEIQNDLTALVQRNGKPQ